MGQDLKIDARREIRKRSSTGAALSIPLCQKIAIFFNFVSRPFLELFGLKLEAKKDPKYVKNRIFDILLASSISCVDSTSLGTGFWSSRGDPDLPKALKNQWFLKLFRFGAFCRLGEIWDDFGLENDTQKTSKNDKTKKKSDAENESFFCIPFF